MGRFPFADYQVFQHQHAVVFEEINNNLKECQREGKPGSFKVKPVEMRKINDSFIKFIRMCLGFIRNC